MKVFKWLVVLLILASCSSGQAPETTIADLLPVDTAAINPENAARALVIAQDFRVTLIRVVKKTAPAKIEVLRPYDSSFRETWRRANSYVTAWKLGQPVQEQFKSEYRTLIDTALQLENARRQ